MTRPSRDASTDAATAHHALATLLAAFRSNDGADDPPDPSVPAARLWEASTARFRSKLGGPGHLADLFGNPAWAPLLGHRSATVDDVRVIEDAARAEVLVHAHDGAAVRYLASLVRTSDPADPAWRLSGLVRAELADL